MDHPHTEQKLEASEQKYRSLLANIPDVVWTGDSSGHVLFVSPNVERVYGYSPAELCATGAALWLSRIHRNDVEDVRAAYEALFSEGKRFDIEYRLQRKDGSWIWVHDRALTTRDVDGIQCADGICTDVTDRKRLEDEFRQAQKMEAIGRLAGGIAHDFNNLLTAILGYCELLLDGPLEGSAAKSDVLEIQKAGESAAALTRQLLAFSRKQRVQSVPLDLNGVIEDTTKMLRRVIGEDVDLVTALDPNLRLIHGDRSQLEQVLMNLAVNARDAMRTGGRLTVATSNVQVHEGGSPKHELAPGDYVTLSIVDTGCGMAREIMSRLFEPFFTTKERGKGTGLGLSTVYGIVKQSGGEIAVSSEVGTGSQFTLYFPALEHGHSDSARRRAAANSPPPDGHETILVVDDDEQVRRLAQRMLRRGGYRVLEAGGGADALKKARRHDGPIALLLSDVVMRDIPGPELRRLLARERPDLRCLYMTGYAGDTHHFAGLDDACTKVVSKPFARAALLQRVRETIDAPTQSEDCRVPAIATPVQQGSIAMTARAAVSC